MMTILVVGNNTAVICILSACHLIYPKLIVNGTLSVSNVHSNSVVIFPRRNSIHNVSISILGPLNVRPTSTITICSTAHMAKSKETTTHTRKCSSGYKTFQCNAQDDEQKKNDKHKFVYPNIYGAQSSKRMTHSILRQSFNTVYQPRCHAMKIDSDHGDHGLPWTHLLRRSGLICLTAGGATRAPASHPSPVQQCPSFTPMSTRTMTVCVCFCLNLKNAHCWMSVSSRLCVVSAQTAPATIQFYYG